RFINPLVEIKLTIGSHIAIVNGKFVAIDITNPRVVPVIKNNRTLVPLRFLVRYCIGYYTIAISWRFRVRVIGLRIRRKRVWSVLTSRHDPAMIIGMVNMFNKGGQNLMGIYKAV
ncbi:hypothetical protein HKBW3S34_02469, partial [Candidatus Hakubella thermalkaliphila]